MRQKIDNLKGEVEFRKILAKQHVTGEILLPNYYGKEDHDKILLERINTTRKDIEQLKMKGTDLTPFLEVGAERCHRSLVLTNEYNLKGFAIDISFDQLKVAEHFASLFKLPKLPVRVCCDANNLPFKNNSFPFVFSYEFLHHFPTPRPIVKEIHRVISKGIYSFNSEPFKTPRIILYKQKDKIYSSNFLQRSKVIKFLEKYISVENCDEREYGVIENKNISIREWIRSLDIFNMRDVELLSSLKIKSHLGKGISIRNFLNIILGGSIYGICRKESSDNHVFSNDLYDLLCCPDCLKSQKNVDNVSSLEKNANFFKCPKCKSIFPIVDGISVLLPKDLLHELYPEIEKNTQVLYENNHMTV